MMCFGCGDSRSGVQGNLATSTHPPFCMGWVEEVRRSGHISEHAGHPSSRGQDVGAAAGSTTNRQACPAADGCPVYLGVGICYGCSLGYVCPACLVVALLC